MKIAIVVVSGDENKMKMWIMKMINLVKLEPDSE